MLRAGPRRAARALRVTSTTHRPFFSTLGVDEEPPPVVVVREEETPGWTEIVVTLHAATLRFRVDEREWTCSGRVPARTFESLREPLERIFPELRPGRERPGPGAQPL